MFGVGWLVRFYFVPHNWPSDCVDLGVGLGYPKLDPPRPSIRLPPWQRSDPQLDWDHVSPVSTFALCFLFPSDNRASKRERAREKRCFVVWSRDQYYWVIPMGPPINNLQSSFRSLKNGWTGTKLKIKCDRVTNAAFLCVCGVCVSIFWINIFGIGVDNSRPEFQCSLGSDTEAKRVKQTWWIFCRDQ